MKKNDRKPYAFVALLLVLPVWLIQAQSGNLSVNNYPVSLPKVTHTNFALQQGSDGRLYVANTKGVLIYDGAQWSIAHTPATPYALAVDLTTGGNVYVGGQGDFGYLENDITGQAVFKSLSEGLKNVGSIFGIGILAGKVYFLSEMQLYQVDIDSHEITRTWTASAANPFTGLAVLQSQVYVNVSGQGLKRVTSTALQLVAGTEDVARTPILSAIPFSKGRILLVTGSNRLFLFDGKKLHPWSVQATRYLATHVLSGGTDLSATTLALATVSGGCVIIDKQTGNTRHIVNFQTGLPDDEVQAVGADHRGGLWICHPMGISRADTRLPIENYGTYPGLVGNVTQVLHLNRTLYVATTEGVFYLDKVDSYGEVSGLVKQKRQIQQLTKTIKITESRKGLGFLSPLFGGKSNRKVETSQQMDVVNVEDESAWSRSGQEIYAMQSIPYLFKRVEGFTGKCKQLVAFGGKVAAAGSNGLFSINNQTAQLILPNQYVQVVYPAAQSQNRLFVGTNTGLFSVVNQGGWKMKDHTKQVNKPVSYVCQVGEHLWLGSENQVMRVQLQQGKPGAAQVYAIPNQYAESIPVFMVAGKPAFFLASGVYRYDAPTDKLTPDASFTFTIQPETLPVYGQADLNYGWINSRWQELSGTRKLNSQSASLLNLFGEITHVFVDDRKNLWVATEENAVFKIDATQPLAVYEPLTVYLSRVTDKVGKRLPLDEVTVDYEHNTLHFALSTRRYGHESAIQYQFRVEGMSKEWSDWHSSPVVDFPVLPGGSFTLQSRARDASGTVSATSEFPFYVRPPFWERWWFRLLLLAGSGVGVYALIRYRTQRLVAANRELEEKVQARTAEVVRQKNQIEGQRNDLSQQKQQLEVAFADIAKKNQHITGSINYAQKIQQAILPLQQQIQESLNEVFVLFKPRDIVSGDFYWFSQQEDCVIIAAVDCTGHGVPGAFMSMVGNTLLNQIVNEKRITEPAHILALLHQGVRQALRQEADHSERQDGMDIALCKLNKHTHELQYAGANNSLYLTRNGQLEEIKANKFGIGGMQKEERIFTTHTFLLTETTGCYLFSDGYADQFGGPENKKFMSKRFRQLLLDIHTKPGAEQREVLDQTIEQWRGHEAQLDDILVIGFRIPAPVAALSDNPTYLVVQTEG